MELKVFGASEAKKQMDILADFRIRFFKMYPYLYEGTKAYEEEYLSGFFNHHEARLVLALDQEHVVGVFTSIPLISDYVIVEEVETIFEREKANASEYVYFGEVIIAEPYRHQGLARRLFAQEEKHAQTMGYKGACFLTVQRSRGDVRRPETYEEPENLWIKLGYRPLESTTWFQWPTIQENGIVVEQENEMQFWIKVFPQDSSVLNQ